MAETNCTKAKPPRTNSARLGYAILGFLILLATAVAYVTLLVWEIPVPAPLMAWLIGLGLVPALYCFKAARRISTEFGNIQTDELGPFVLYLRPFTADRTIAPINSNISLVDTADEALYEVLKTRFKFLAVSNPSDEAPTLGSQKLKLREHEWKRHVESLIDRASFIVLRPGRSEGVAWELTTLWQRGAFERLALFFPPDEGEIVDFDNVARMIFEKSNGAVRLPAEAKGVTFIAFGQDHEPIFRTEYLPFSRLRYFSLDRERAFYISIRCPPNNWSFRKYIRMLAHASPAILYRAELIAVLKQAADLPDIPTNWKDYAFYYPLIFIAKVMVPLIAVVGVGLLAFFC